MRHAVTVLALLSLAGVARAEPPRETIHFVHQPFASEMEREHVERNRFSIVLVPEGWTQAELNQREDVDVEYEYEVDDAFIKGKKTKMTEKRKYPGWASTCERLKTALLNKEPFKTYRNFLKITRIDVPSKESGVTRITDNVTRSVDTAFGTILRPDPINRVPDRGFGFIDPEESKRTIKKLCEGLSAKVVVILVNDRKLRKNLDRGTAFPDGDPAHVIETANTDGADETFVHELGHAVANLGDEYTERGIPPYDRGEPSQRNLTTRSPVDQCKWKHWAKMPGIGLEPGGYRATEGIYHPSKTCCMIDNRPEFCIVCKERIIQRLYEVVTLIDAVDPDLDAREAAGEKNPRLREKGQKLTVTTVGPVPPIPEMSTIRGEWTYKNGTFRKMPSRISQVGPVFEFNLPDDATSDVVKFVAFDATPLVQVTAGEEGSESNLRNRSRAQDGGLRSAQATTRTWKTGFTLKSAAELQRTRETEAR